MVQDKITVERLNLKVRDVLGCRCTMALLYGNGTGTFQNPQYFTAGFGPRWLAVAGINGDSKMDLLTSDEIFNEVSIVLRQ